MDMCTQPGANSTQALEDALRDTRRALIQTVHAISAVAGHRDHYTARHQRDTAMLALAIGRAMGVSDHQLEGLYLGALVHDIGKIAIPSELLAKPAKLTAEEFALVRTHVPSGCAILEHVSLPWPVHSIIRQHHERLDGSGYPDGLKGDAIIVEARIVAVADVFQAMTDHRPYRAALGAALALAEIERGAGSVFDEEAVAALVEVVRSADREKTSIWARIEADEAHASTVVLPRPFPGFSPE